MDHKTRGAGGGRAKAVKAAQQRSQLELAQALARTARAVGASATRIPGEATLAAGAQPPALLGATDDPAAAAAPDATALAVAVSALSRPAPPSAAASFAAPPLAPRRAFGSPRLPLSPR